MAIKRIELTVDFTREGDLYSAVCREVDIASQGATIEEARLNVEEAVALWLESASEDEVNATLPPWTHSEQTRYTARIEVPYGQAEGIARDRFAPKLLT